MVEKDFVKVARYRSLPYVVNCPITNKKFIWSGSKGKRINIISIPRETYDWLISETAAFENGNLVAVDEEDKQDVNDSIEDPERLKRNVHTREEIENLINGNYKALQKALKNITDSNEKDFVLQVAKEMKIDSNTKRKIIKDWYGVSEDIFTEEIFDQE